MSRWRRFAGAPLLATRTHGPRHNNLGKFSVAQGRLDEAAGEYQATLRLKPSDASAHSNLGIVYAKLHRLDEAIAEYHAALAITPENAKFWFNLGNALRAQRRKEEAARCVLARHRVQRDRQGCIAPRYELGSVLLESGPAKEAGLQAESS